MTVVSDIYDGYITLIAATLPSYERIPNGLDIEGSGGILRTKGFAVIPTIAVNTERQLDCRLSVIRNYTVTLVNQMTSTVSSASATDDIYKSLLEDALSIQSAVEKSTTLNNSSSGLGITKFTDDTGLFFLSGEREKYIQLNINFETEFFVNI